MYDDTIQVKIRTTGDGSCRVTVAGELDVCTAPAVRNALRDVLIRHERVDVDCAGVSFCDCSGLSALLAAARTAKAVKAELRLCAVPRVLALLLRLSHTGRAFTIEQPSAP
ncbi:STAS domain-containing protein [Streptomyces sp. NPDC005373]|uniref:STAS domain-containing protein n=1 Tax=Streptomyces sp. NPDC005373 TaxID=3156879 RepID=UPI0033B1DD52